MSKEMSTIQLSESILIRIARLDINQDAITFDECIGNLLKNYCDLEEQLGE